MQIVLSDRAIESLKDAPPSVRRAFEKQLRFLATNLLHPSLCAKKYHESANRWQARVNRNWRFYFTIEGDTYRIEDVIAHPK
jgi:mRNA-degrading endonuclease RelE of RelBE toxin-antitoxin system